MIEFNSPSKGSSRSDCECDEETCVQGPYGSENTSVKFTRERFDQDILSTPNSNSTVAFSKSRHSGACIPAGQVLWSALQPILKQLLYVQTPAIGVTNTVPQHTGYHNEWCEQMQVQLRQRTPLWPSATAGSDKLRFAEMTCIIALTSSTSAAGLPFA